MNWLVASVITLLLWGSYSIFADKATRIHGEKISFVFELFGMIVVAIVVFASQGGFEGFKRVTAQSLAYAMIMGIMTSAAAFFLLYALRLAPTPNHVPLIVVIAGCYPIITAVLAHLFLNSRLSLVQWIGMLVVGAGLILINYKT